MEQLFELYPSITKNSIENIEPVLKLYSNLKYFKDSRTGQLQSLSSHITTSLSNKKTRYEGLYYLKVFLGQCPADLLLENGLTWVVSCIKACQNDDLSVRNMCYLTIAPLLKSVSGLPELNKMVSSTNISKLVECIISEEKMISSLYCLEVCLKHYPGACGPSKSNIEVFLLEFLDVQDVQKIKLSAKCMHLLQQVSGSGVKGTTHKTAWEQQFRMTIGSLHTLMDLLYANVMEAVMKPDDQIALNLPSIELPENPVRQMFELSKRFNNVCVFLQAMLSEPFPVPKRVQPDLVLNLITRGLGVTCRTLDRVSTDNMILGAFLSSLHVSLLKTLDALLFCLGRNALRYGQIICSIVSRTLKWTQPEKDEIGTQPYRNVRAAAYETLVRWLKVANLGSSIERHADEVVTCIMSDVAPQRVQLKLTTTEQTQMSKQAARELTNNRNCVGKNVNQVCEGDDKLCQSALLCLHVLLSSTGKFLKPTMHKSLQTSLANILLDLQRGQMSYSMYRDNDCRLQLYNVFMTLVLNPSPIFPPPTHLAVIILSRGQLDANEQIKQMCTELLGTIKKIIMSSSMTKDDKNNGLMDTNDTEQQPMVTQEELLQNHIAMTDNIMSNLNAEQQENLEITSSQDSQKTVIVDSSDKEHQEQLTNGDTELVDTDVVDDVVTLEEDVIDINFGKSIDQSNTSAILVESDEIPAKRTKYSEENISDISFQLENVVNNTELLDAEAVKSSEQLNLSATNVQITESETNNMLQNAVNPIDGSQLSDIISDKVSVGKLTVDEMLSSFISEPNDIL